jgi:putative ABC transport system substrate-binding protein
MKKWIVIFLLLGCILPACKKDEKKLYTMAVFQVNDAPTLNEVRKGFIKAVEDRGYQNEKNIRLIFRNAFGDIKQMQRIAQQSVLKEVDLMIPFSTPSLQAALHATGKIPIVFSSVANPYLAGAGKSASDHLSHVTGVSSKGPIKQSLKFIKEVLPDTRRIGTLWTPSEINSQYYLNLAREGARDLGFRIIAVPVTFLLSTYEGACAALGWDFFDMGYKAGIIALRVMEGENPALIPIENMKDTRLYINLSAAKKQGLRFPDAIIQRAHKVETKDRE